MGQQALHAVKIGFAQACRQAEDGGLQNAAHAVTVGTGGPDGGFHGFFHGGVQQGKALRLAHQCFCLSGQCGGVIQRERRIGDARAPGNMGGNVNARPAQGVQHDGTARHQRGSDAAGEVSAAPGILKAVVFGVGRIIGVAGAEQVGGLGVIAAAGVLVLDHQGNGRAGGVAVDHARKKLDLIGLHPGGGKTVAPGPALVHAGCNAGLVHGDACRHAVQHRADGGTMALAENGQRQRAAVSVFHGLIPPCPAGGAGPLPGWSRPASSQGRGP